MFQLLEDAAAITSEQSNSVDTQDKVPGRTIGITVMTLTIAFVAFWMNQQHVRDTNRVQSPTSITSESDLAVDGFRADAWFLADDDLLGFVEIPAWQFIIVAQEVGRVDEVAEDL